MEKAQAMLIKLCFIALVSVPVCGIIFGLSYAIVQLFGISSKGSLYKPMVSTTAMLCLLGSYYAGTEAYQKYASWREGKKG